MSLMDAYEGGFIDGIGVTLVTTKSTVSFLFNTDACLHTFSVDRLVRRPSIKDVRKIFPFCDYNSALK